MLVKSGSPPKDVIASLSGGRTDRSRLRKANEASVYTNGRQLT